MPRDTENSQQTAANSNDNNDSNVIANNNIDGMRVPPADYVYWGSSRDVKQEDAKKIIEIKNKNRILLLGNDRVRLKDRYAWVYQDTGEIVDPSKLENREPIEIAHKLYYYIPNEKSTISNSNFNIPEQANSRPVVLIKHWLSSYAWVFITDSQDILYVPRTEYPNIEFDEENDVHFIQKGKNKYYVTICSELNNKKNKILNNNNQIQNDNYVDLNNINQLPNNNNDNNHNNYNNNNYNNNNYNNNNYNNNNYNNNNYNNNNYNNNNYNNNNFSNNVNEQINQLTFYYDGNPNTAIDISWEGSFKRQVGNETCTRPSDFLQFCLATFGLNELFTIIPEDTHNRFKFLFKTPMVNRFTLIDIFKAFLSLDDKQIGPIAIYFKKQLLQAKNPIIITDDNRQTETIHNFLNDNFWDNLSQSEIEACQNLFAGVDVDVNLNLPDEISSVNNNQSASINDAIQNDNNIIFSPSLSSKLNNALIINDKYNQVTYITPRMKEDISDVFNDLNPFSHAFSIRYDTSMFILENKPEKNLDIAQILKNNFPNAVIRNLIGQFGNPTCFYDGDPNNSIRLGWTGSFVIKADGNTFTPSNFLTICLTKVGLGELFAITPHTQNRFSFSFKAPIINPTFTLIDIFQAFVNQDMTQIAQIVTYFKQQFLQAKNPVVIPDDSYETNSTNNFLNDPFWNNLSQSEFEAYQDLFSAVDVNSTLPNEISLNSNNNNNNQVASTSVPSSMPPTPVCVSNSIRLFQSNELPSNKRQSPDSETPMQTTSNKIARNNNSLS